MTIYSVAIIGCGGIGYQYNRSHKRQGTLSYFRVFHTSPNFRVVGVADVDDEIRDEIHQQFNVPGYRNVQELLESRHADVDPNSFWRTFCFFQHHRCHEYVRLLG